jgi:hypothetical protein
MFLNVTAATDNAERFRNRRREEKFLGVILIFLISKVKKMVVKDNKLV